jgi:hypothetical protein
LYRLTFGISAWLLVVVAGSFWLHRYARTPGEAADAAPSPDDVHAAELPGFRLLVFLHPECPCSRATLAELARLMAQTGDRRRVAVVFVGPRAEGDREASRLEGIAGEMPGVEIRWDSRGNESRRFGARTSGHVVLLDGRGEVRFRGGITRARGHEGDSPGREAVRAVVRGDTHASEPTPVFGCRLTTSPD